ncbi:hypothetical protein [Paenibacillus alvei]|uniref:Uncharacterized protein n=1 Tax=Paenibacillus alvei TaxID=44250 RepID=A0AAP7A2E9_PAEAL|nr:hypothetical protein [Paenibacillus alvei]MCY9580686.1 hypothetical protein [Paenibacillus alvei]MCY9585169.1 hypothetical protein [Paenibacillus alvei]NOJ72166.1 hypothetical protein [Paenibacillus alvei]
MSSNELGITYRVGSNQSIVRVTPVRPVAGKSERFPDTYPPVDSSKFVSSANSTHSLAEQAVRVLDRLRKSSTLATAIMDAAQRGNRTEVTRLIRDIGVQSRLEVKSTPDGIKLTFNTDSSESRCCELEVKMRWNPI